MYDCAEDPVTGEKYGWGRVLDYIGVDWEDEYVDLEAAKAVAQTLSGEN